MGNNASLLVKAREAYQKELQGIKTETAKRFDLNALAETPLSVKDMETSIKGFKAGREDLFAQMIKNYKEHGTFLAQDKKEEVVATL